MSTTYKGFSVVLRQDISEERIAAIQTAFRLLDGVVDIVPVETDNPDFYIAARVRIDLLEKVREWAFPSRKT